MHHKLAILALVLNAVVASAAEGNRERVCALVAQIQRADYEGDRGVLGKCFDELAPFAQDATLASRVNYWRGFALWRRAINGFNDQVDPNELERDLRQAIEQFKASAEKDHAFVDAKVGMISCLGFLCFMKRGDTNALKDLLGEMSPLVADAKAAAPDNPRLRWVLGPIIWYQVRQAQTGSNKVIENYKQGLEHCSAGEEKLGSLEPGWGKPELLMSLAYTYLNDASPNLEAAEENARAALALIPYWHYTRDILLPQILSAKAKTTGAAR